MEREEKKYEILPGIKTPDIKSIMSAASDFSTPGVEKVKIKGMHDDRPAAAPVAAPSGEDIDKLKALGAQVAEAEEAAKEESRKRMEAIKSAAVMAPESFKDLQEAAVSGPMSEERRQALIKEREEKESRRAEEEAKQKAREERRLAQQKVIEEAQARKAAAQAEEQARLEAEQAEAAKLASEQEKAEKIKRQQEEKALNAERDAAIKNERDDEYKEWVKAKREEAKRKAGVIKPEENDNVAEAGEAAQEAVEEEAEETLEDIFEEAAAVEEKSSDEPADLADAVASDSETLDDFSEFL